MTKRTQRAAKRSQYRNRRIQSYAIWGGIGLGALALMGALIYNTIRPTAGEEVPIMPSREHIPEGTDPGTYNTNPPTSGHHYPTPIRAGFYEAADLAPLGEHPEGYLVHNLEHGYVIFWYNCDALQGGDCEQLMSQIRQVMDDADNFKVIAVPWDSIDVPVAMTSWGHLLRMQKFDASTAMDFIQRNRGRAPEPNGA